MSLDEGWYLMSTEDLERELRRWSGATGVLRSNAVRLSIEEALAYRDRGNLPDDMGRTLRLLLHARTSQEVAGLARRRLLFEPDAHDHPSWRRPGSVPVNLVPLRDPGVKGPHVSPWWEQDEMKAMESEWATRGRVAGIAVPDQYRGLVYKTIAALVDAGKEITPDSVADSAARWLSPKSVAELRRALHDANRAS